MGTTKVPYRPAMGFVLTLSACLTGCSEVVLVQEPLGERLSRSECEDLQGFWSVENEGGGAEARLTRQNDLIMGEMYWDEKVERFRLRSLKVIPTRIGDHSFMNVAPLLPGNAEGYLFFRYERPDQNAIRLFSPVFSEFQRAVDQGELTGTVAIAREDSGLVFEHERTTVSISSAASLRKFLEQRGIDACFQKEAGIFVRHGGPDRRNHGDLKTEGQQGPQGETRKQ